MGDGGYSRIRHELVQDLIEHHGKGAYSYASVSYTHLTLPTNREV